MHGFGAQREVGVAIEMLLTTAEQVRTTGRAPPDHALGGSMAQGLRLTCAPVLVLATDGARAPAAL
jgi:hypothetical protein